MGHLLPRVERFGIDSYRRLLGGRRGCVGLGVGQLGPDVLPVVRAEVAAGYGAVSDYLNPHALFGRDITSTVSSPSKPLPYGGRGHTQQCREGTLATCDLDRTMHRINSDCFHGLE